MAFYRLFDRWPWPTRAQPVAVAAGPAVGVIPADGVEVDDAMEASVTRQFYLRVMPVLGLLSMVAWMDRQNVAFAKLQMAQDLGMSEYAYGLGASLFFLSYTIFQLPNGLLIARFGPVRWFAPAAVCWGGLTIALAVSHNVGLFYLLRFLLGLVEAGFYTGSIYLLTLWLPYSRRAQANGMLLGAGLAANIVTGPLCGVMLDLDQVGGLQGWQWVFIATGAPSLIFGLLIPLLLSDTPERAKFFNEDQRRWLAARLQEERRHLRERRPPTVMEGLRNPVVGLIAVPVLTIGMGSIGTIYWLPTIVAQFGVSNTVNGFLNAIPWIAVVAALAWWPRRAERRNERLWHCMLPLGASCIAALGVPFVDNPTVQFLLLTICTVGIFTAQPIIWSFPGRLLQGQAVAAVLGAAGILANTGAFAAQNIIPWIGQATGDVRAPMYFVAGMMALAVISTAVLVRRSEAAATPVQERARA